MIVIYLSYFLSQSLQSMIINAKKVFIVLINNAIQNKSYTKMNNPHKFFISNTFWGFASIKGRINFLQLGWFGKFCEQYFRINVQKKFDFLSFNTTLIKENLSGDLAIAIDPSYIGKSGKCTEGVGNFWSGSASKAKWGLELCGFALVDILANTAYHLTAYQSTCSQELKQQNSDLLSYDGNLVKEHPKEWLKLSKYLLADACFSKKHLLTRPSMLECI